jgi:hypothetical protein
MPKVFIGLNQGLTEAGKKGVGTMNTVCCNHWLWYLSWARSSLTKGNLISYILRRLVVAQSISVPDRDRADQSQSETEKQVSFSSFTWLVTCLEAPDSWGRLTTNQAGSAGGESRAHHTMPIWGILTPVPWLITTMTALLLMHGLQASQELLPRRGSDVTKW